MLCPVFHCNFLMHNFAKWPKKQRKTRHELNETHNSMSVLFMVCASNNFQINHQLSFEYEKKQFSYDDIHRHSKIHYGICLYSANVNWVLVFFSSFRLFTSSLRIRCDSLCVSFLPTQTTFNQYTIFSVLAPSLLPLVCSVWRRYTHIYMYLHVSIYHTQKIHRRYVGPSANDSLSHQQLHFDCQRFRQNK